MKALVPSCDAILGCRPTQAARSPLCTTPTGWPGSTFAHSRNSDSSAKLVLPLQVFKWATAPGVRPFLTFEGPVDKPTSVTIKGKLVSRQCAVFSVVHVALVDAGAGSDPSR